MTIDQRAVRSRAALMTAACQLFIQNPSASLSDVAKHAKVGRATLYRHFESREQLIQELAQESLQATEEALAPLYQKHMSCWDYLMESLALIMPLADKYHFLVVQWDIVSQSDEVNSVYQQQIDELTQLIEGAKSEGSLNPALNNDWVSQLYDMALYIGWSLVQQQKLTVDEAIEQAKITLGQGLKA